MHTTLILPAKRDAGADAVHVVLIRGPAFGDAGAGLAVGVHDVAGEELLPEGKATRGSWERVSDGFRLLAPYDSRASA